MYDFIKKVSAKELKGVSPGFIQGEIHFVPQFQFSTARPGFGLTTTPARVKTRTDPFTAGGSLSDHCNVGAVVVMEGCSMTPNEKS
jgi:hypothetical protein